MGHPCGVHVIPLWYTRGHPCSVHVIPMWCVCKTVNVHVVVFISDGLFHRILTRGVRWSQEQGGREPRLFYRQARFYVDDAHDFVLEMAPARFARLKVGAL